MEKTEDATPTLELAEKPTLQSAEELVTPIPLDEQKSKSKCVAKHKRPEDVQALVDELKSQKKAMKALEEKRNAEVCELQAMVCRADEAKTKAEQERDAARNEVAIYKTSSMPLVTSTPNSIPSGPAPSDMNSASITVVDAHKISSAQVLKNSDSNPCSPSVCSSSVGSSATTKGVSQSRIPATSHSTSPRSITSPESVSSSAISCQTKGKGKGAPPLPSSKGGGKGPPLPGGKGTLLLPAGEGDTAAVKNSFVNVLWTKTRAPVASKIPCAGDPFLAKLLVDPENPEALLDADKEFKLADSVPPITIFDEDIELPTVPALLCTRYFDNNARDVKKVFGKSIKKELFSLLDTQVLQQLEMILHAVRKMNGLKNCEDAVPIIVKTLRQCNPDILAMEHLSTLRKVLESTEEKRSVIVGHFDKHQKTGGMDEIQSPASHFLYYHLCKIDNIIDRITHMVFASEFHEMVKAAWTRINVVRKAMAVLEARKVELCKFFQLVKTIGNKLNAGLTSRVAPRGFSLRSLDVLERAKSTRVGNYSVLHFVLIMMEGFEFSDKELQELREGKDMSAFAVYETCRQLLTSVHACHRLVRKYKTADSDFSKDGYLKSLEAFTSRVGQETNEISAASTAFFTQYKNWAIFLDDLDYLWPPASEEDKDRADLFALMYNFAIRVNKCGKLLHVTKMKVEELYASCEAESDENKENRIKDEEQEKLDVDEKKKQLTLSDCAASSDDEGNGGMSRGMRCMSISSRRKRLVQTKVNNADDSNVRVENNLNEIAASVVQRARNMSLGKDSDEVIKNPPATALTAATVETKTAARVVETKTEAKEAGTETATKETANKTVTKAVEAETVVKKREAIPLTTHRGASPARGRELEKAPQMEEMVGKTRVTDGASTSIGDADDIIPSVSPSIGDADDIIFTVSLPIGDADDIIPSVSPSVDDADAINLSVSPSTGDADDIIPLESQEMEVCRRPLTKFFPNDFVGGEVGAESRAASVAHVAGEEASDPQAVTSGFVAACSTLTSLGIRRAACDTGKDSAPRASRSGSVLGGAAVTRKDKNDNRTDSRGRLRAAPDRSVINSIPTLGTASARLMGRVPPLACESTVESTSSVSVSVAKCDAVRQGSATDTKCKNVFRVHGAEDEHQGRVKKTGATEDSALKKNDTEDRCPKNTTAGPVKNTATDGTLEAPSARALAEMIIRSVPDASLSAPNVKAEASYGEICLAENSSTMSKRDGSVDRKASASCEEIRGDVRKVNLKDEASDASLSKTESSIVRNNSIVENELAASSVRTPVKPKKGSLKEQTSTASLSVTEFVSLTRNSIVEHEPAASSAQTSVKPERGCFEEQTSMAILSVTESASSTKNSIAENEPVASRIQTLVKPKRGSLQEQKSTASLCATESAASTKNNLVQNEPVASSVRTPVKPKRGSSKEQKSTASIGVTEFANLRRHSLAEEELGTTSHKAISSRKNSLADETSVTPNVKPRSRYGADRLSIGSSATSAGTTSMSETKKHPDSATKSRNTLARYGRSNTTPLSHAEILSALTGGGPAKTENKTTGKASKVDKEDKPNKSDKKNKKNRKGDVENNQKTAKMEDKVANAEDVPAKGVKEAEVGIVDTESKANTVNGSRHDDASTTCVADPLNALTDVAAPRQRRTPILALTPIAQTPPTSPLVAVVRTLPTPTNRSSSDKAMSPVQQMLTSKKLPKPSMLFHSPLPGPRATSSESASNDGFFSSGTSTSNSAATSRQERSKELKSDTSEGGSAKQIDSDSLCTSPSSRGALTTRKASARSTAKAKSLNGRHPSVVIKRRAKPLTRSHFLDAARSSAILSARSDGNGSNDAIGTSPKAPRPGTLQAVRQNTDARYDASVPPRRSTSSRARKHHVRTGSSKRRSSSAGSTMRRVSVGHKVRSMFNSPPSKQYANQQVSDAEWSSSDSGTEEEIRC